jgi:hypothetical protein
MEKFIWAQVPEVLVHGWLYWYGSVVRQNVMEVGGHCGTERLTSWQLGTERQSKDKTWDGIVPFKTMLPVAYFLQSDSAFYSFPIPHSSIG